MRRGGVNGELQGASLGASLDISSRCLCFMIPTVEYILAGRRTALCIDNVEPER